MKELKALLGRNALAAVVDGSGGALFGQYVRLMKPGGIIAQYGQTASPKGVGFSMAHVLKHVDIRGSTMGSRREFKDMVAFVEKHKIKPVVSHTFKGLTQATLDKALDTLAYVPWSFITEKKYRQD